MIRRVIAGLFFIYLSLWLGVALIVEYKITHLTNNGFECSGISVSGFPNKWIFTIYDPSLIVQSTEETQVLSSDSLTFAMDLGGKKIVFEVNELFLGDGLDGCGGYFSANSEQPLATSLKLSKSVFFSPSMLVSSLDFTGHDVHFSASDEELFVVEDALISVQKQKIHAGDLFHFSINSSYAGAEDILGFSSMKLDLDADVEVALNVENDKILLKEVEFNNFGLIIDDDAYLGIVGKIALAKDKRPSGRLDIDIQNYQEMIDLLWPDSFDLTAQDAKSILAEAASNAETLDIKCPIIFSESGITINGQNLVDLKE